MLVGDSWDEITDDVITEIKCNYTLAGEPKVLRLKRLTHQSVGGSGYPFHANDEIRGHFLLQEISKRSENELLFNYKLTTEIKGKDKPALVCDWLSLSVF